MCAGDLGLGCTFCSQVTWDIFKTYFQAYSWIGMDGGGGGGYVCHVH